MKYEPLSLKLQVLLNSEQNLLIKYIAFPIVLLQFSLVFASLWESEIEQKPTNLCYDNFITAASLSQNWRVW